MTDISRISLPNRQGQSISYTIKDSQARNEIAALKNSVKTNLSYRGVTPTQLVDGANTSPIILDQKSYTPQVGDVVIYNRTINGVETPIEFVYSGTVWNEFGPAGSLRALAFKDEVTGTFIPNGTIDNFSVTGAATTITFNYTPSGNITNGLEFVGTPTAFSISSDVTGDLNVNYTPSGTITTPSFTGTNATIAVYGASAPPGDVTYTPEGTVDAPIISIIPATETIHQFQTAGELPTFNMEVEDQILSFEWDPGSTPTYEDREVIVGILSAAATSPAFHGVGTKLSANYTPTGRVTAPTFRGQQATLSASLSGGGMDATINYTPSGTITVPEFVGQQTSITTTFTPRLTVSAPTFRGMTTTVTSS